MSRIDPAIEATCRRRAAAGDRLLRAVLAELDRERREHVKTERALRDLVEDTWAWLCGGAA